MTIFKGLKINKDSLHFLLYSQSSYTISELDGAFNIFEAKAFNSNYIWKPLSRPCAISLGEGLSKPEEDGSP